MTRFRLAHGTGPQRRIVHLALRDLSRASGRGPFLARKLGPRCRQICFSDERFDVGPDDDMHAYYQQPTTRSQLIVLRPYLQGAQLYCVLVHELGHFFGLDHKPAGIMAVATLRANRMGAGWPTERQRLRIMRQLCILLAVHHTKVLDASS